MRLRLHHFLSCSYANGPGRRAVLWVQGCTLACPSCFNPKTHALDHGDWIEVADLAQTLERCAQKLDGLTLSGGEPLQQLPAVTELVRRVKQSTPLSILLFTGFCWTEVQRMPGIATLLDCLDVLIAGRYDPHQRLASGLRGSVNKTIHLLSARYSLSDLEQVPCAEVIFDTNGQIQATGINPLCL